MELAMLLFHEIGSETTLECLDASKHPLLTMFTLADGFISGKQGPPVARGAVSVVRLKYRNLVKILQLYSIYCFLFTVIYIMC